MPRRPDAKPVMRLEVPARHTEAVRVAWLTVT